MLREGSETAYFWVSLSDFLSVTYKLTPLPSQHGLDGLEYASAHYWRFRRTHPQKVAVVSIDSTAMPIVSRVESLELSDTSISLIDGGFSEHWIVVPAAARSKRADLSIALEAADELAGLWRERGFAFKQPYHVSCPVSVDTPRADHAPPQRFCSSPRSSRGICPISLVSSTLASW